MRNPGSDQALSKPQRNRSMLVAGIAICLFGIAALVAIYVFIVRPAKETERWQPVDCEITKSRIVESKDQESTSYHFEVSFRYTVKGVSYTGSKYQLIGEAKSSRAALEPLLVSYRPGTRSTAYVDPADPTRAVLRRGSTLNLLGIFASAFGVWLAIGLALVLGGLGVFRRHRLPSRVRWQPAPSVPGLNYTPRAVSAPASAVESVGSTASTTASPSNLGPKVERWKPAGELLLTAESTPGREVLGYSLALLVFGGVGIYLFQRALGGPAVDIAELVFAAFLGAFCLFLIYGIVRALLSLANPVPDVTLGAFEAPLGENVEVSWTFRGHTKSVRRVVLTLEGREEATYTAGTDKATAKSLFRKDKLLSTSDRRQIGSHQMTFAVPADSMHSFVGGNNKIVWRLRLVGEIDWWPDVNYTYELHVPPRAGSGGEDDDA